MISETELIEIGARARAMCNVGSDVASDIGEALQEEGECTEVVEDWDLVGGRVAADTERMVEELRALQSVVVAVEKVRRPV